MDIIEFPKDHNYNSSMAQYAIAFDMDTIKMKDSGMSDSERTQIYQIEIPQALSKCGFSEHPQGSLYHTRVDQDPITAIMKLQNILKQEAPNFGKWVRRVHIFRMEEWSDVTDLLSDSQHDNKEVNVEIEMEEDIISQFLSS
jgi:virulence-associated protein VapD